MSGLGRHTLRAQPLTLTRLGVTATVVAGMAVGAMIAAVVTERPASGETVTVTASPSPASPSTASPVARANAVPAIHGHAPAPAHPARVSLVLTAANHHDCPTTATACVDVVFRQAVSALALPSS